MDKTKKAVEVLKNGGIVIFPTDTAIGIGCRIDNAKAIEGLFRIRRRSKSKPLLALVNSVAMAEKYLYPIPEKVKDKLIKNYWPGELTIILKSKINKVSKLVTGGTNTLGVRFPDNPKLLALINAVGVPIVAPSANFAGEKTPFRFEDLNSELVRQVDYVLNEKTSPPAGGEKSVSTVIDCTVEPWKIIREGAVKISNF